MILTLALLGTLMLTGVFAEGEKAVNNNEASYEIEDTNPAIYVAQKNANSVVGVITNVDQWNSWTRETSTSTYSEGSGVVIAEDGYILTNNHVVSSGDSFQVLLPSGDKADAELIGYDSSYDLAVLRVTDPKAVKTLKPVAIGSVEKVYVGSTVIAIGNPGGETLFNTVTSGVISCLSREVRGGNTTRTVEYIQHDAAISSGNSGGGLYDINGNLIGINTLKYGNSSRSNASYEGLGFAIPVDTAWPIAQQIIEYGKVRRLAMGVSLKEVAGADEPTDEETPAGLYVANLSTDGPAKEAGMEVGDYITAIDGERITTIEQFTGKIDSHEEGDIVTVTVARYVEKGSTNPFDDNGEDDYTAAAYTPQSGWGFDWDSDWGWGLPFGGYFNYDEPQQPQYELKMIDLKVKLAYID